MLKFKKLLSHKEMIQWIISSYESNKLFIGFLMIFYPKR